MFAFPLSSHALLSLRCGAFLFLWRISWVCFHVMCQWWNCLFFITKLKKAQRQKKKKRGKLEKADLEAIRKFSWPRSPSLHPSFTGQIPTILPAMTHGSFLSAILYLDTMHAVEGSIDFSQRDSHTLGLSRGPDA
ncbi:hypothetical protein DFH27DRAFT_97557 [Peziza echinospora]|nr:hypothetical protein DFH27DRAFT_97557 [Peziza echinospora]